MLTTRKEIFVEDMEKVRRILLNTGFFDQAPDEIETAISLMELSIKDGNTISNYRHLFAMEGGELLGYVSYAQVPCTISSFEIYWLAVDKNTQGKGVGRYLINEVIKEVKELGGLKLILQTAGRELYNPTHRFYESCCFSEEARIKDYYAKSDDCLIYTLSL